jgi:glutamyl-tRNA reductase
MIIGLLGINHTQTEIKNFEPIFLNKEGKSIFRDAVKNSNIISECVVLTTCNRVEFYFVSSNLEDAKDWIVSQISSQKNLEIVFVSSLLKLYSTNDTVGHLFNVASGVQSMVIGENEILSQVKEAYDNALKLQLTGPLLNKCFQSAVATGKRVRSETEISRGAYSVSSIAIDAIRQTKLDYFGRSILIVGLGTMGFRCLKKLHALAHPTVTLCNRTLAVSKSLAKEYETSYFDYADLAKRVGEFDIVISAVTEKTFIIFSESFNSQADYLLVDLGLPRNIDPNCDNASNIQLINVDGLKEIATKNVKRRQGELSKVEVIVEDEISRFNQWITYKNSYEKRT